MNVAVKKWGNSLAIRIPKDIARSLSMENNTIIEMNIERDKLVIKPKVKTNLESLVSKITFKNLHGEINTGERVGNEEW
jgi:antitoxin MazE